MEIEALNYPPNDSIDIEEDVSHPTFLVANYDCHTFTSDSDDELYDSDDDPYFSPDFNFL
ncbi:1653_t:CDS:1 [Rhizophagus irregularis]|nr:1653_t:CDS:1 [Rhizophagus irregularis]